MDYSRIYIHYGSSQYHREHFVPPKNCWWKPKPEPGTGLWASRVGDPFGWKDWCERNQFSMAGLAQSFCFTLSDSANLLTLHSKEQLMDLPQLSPVDFYRRQSAAGLEFLPDISCLIPENWCFLDYEKMSADGTDAIEKVNWPEFQETLATWDCNSIYIMNPDIIHEMTEKGF